MIFTFDDFQLGPTASAVFHFPDYATVVDQPTNTVQEQPVLAGGSTAQSQVISGSVDAWPT